MTRFHSARWLLLPLIVSFAGVIGAAEVEFDVVQLCRAPIDGPISRWTKEGAFTLIAGGRDAADSCFEGTFAGIETDASNFTFVCRVAKAPTGTPDPQYGVMLRAGLDGPENQVNLRYDGRPGQKAWRWLMKYQVTPSTHDGSTRSYLYDYDRSLTDAEGLWLKVVRDYPYVYLFTSQDGKQWKEFGADYLKVMLAQTVWVGPQLTGGADGKTPATMTFDHISFHVDEGNDTAATEKDWKEYHPPLQPWVYHFALVDTGKAGVQESAFLAMPKDMKPSEIRGLVWSTGNKEITYDYDQHLKFDHDGEKRKPHDMKTWEGRYELKQTRPFNQILSHYKFARLGGAWDVRLYPQVIKRLTEATGFTELPNIPVMPVGASATGGAAARAASLYPDLTVAAGVTLIGMAGADTEDRAVLNTPHLHVFGSKDGGHLKHALQAAPVLRQKHALWAQAPMWRVYHRQHKSFGLIFPYFVDLCEMRVPENVDFAKGPAKLKTLREQDGWYGLNDTWETNFPQITPVNEYRGNSKNLSWLPNERMARLWQAFVSENPLTVIHFPRFEGHANYGFPNSHGWRNSYLAANEPFELVASGPAGDDVKVTYYADLEPLEVLETHGTPLRVTLKAPGPGLRGVYAITEWDGKKEISRPITILFQTRN